MATKKKSLPSGQYELFFKGRKTPLVVQLQAIPISKPLPSGYHQTLPEEGLTKFFVANQKLGIYTSIGADNIHHASNKATKLFGPHWSFLRHENNCKDIIGYVHCTVANFNIAIKTLQI